MSVVIKAENISKQYRLGAVGTGSLKDDFKRWRFQMMGKEDPFLTVGEVNDRTIKTSADYVWALKGISFEVKEGEVLGIIGKNGAGKSTLLKILSRTTGPTTGSLKMKGRIASLLEVGTGFHGELSGRENIFLNGAIMGMSKEEIRKKFDEIVDFAGVEKYIDTPVKRYSSGMYVRLAFGVAAHLEPDILIIDEVLAVGDAEFQKKAIGKMQDVSKEDGRTVLFVSHNLHSVETLCNSGIVLSNGEVVLKGSVHQCLSYYINTSSKEITGRADLKNHPNRVKSLENKLQLFNKIRILNSDNEESTSYRVGEDITFEITLDISANHPAVNAIRFNIDSEREVRVCNIWSDQMLPESLRFDLGQQKIYFKLPMVNFAPGVYKVSTLSALSLKPLMDLDQILDVISFEIVASDIYNVGSVTKLKSNPLICPSPLWSFET